MIKTNLKIEITSIDEAKAYLTELTNNGEMYHLEDDAMDIGYADGSYPSHTDKIQMNYLRDKCFSFKGFCPIGFVLDLIQKMNDDRECGHDLHLKNTNQ